MKLERLEEMKRKNPTFYSVEFKISAVQLVIKEGLRRYEAGRDLGIHPRLISRWVKQYKEAGPTAFPQKGYLKPEEEQVRQLEAKLRRVTMERDILKKAIAYFAEVPK